MDEFGKLFIVATPLGNLEDMTYRGVRTLRDVDIIAAEDTRRTLKIVRHFGLKTRIVSYREQNHQKMMPRLLDELKNGRSIALVSDAGTPVVSDPGAMLVAEAAKHGITVVPVPGPSAAAAALSVSGLSGDSFFFGGFLPSRRKARTDYLETLKTLTSTLVFFETPHRLADAVQDLFDVLGDRQAVICREMTKLNEDIMRGGLSDLNAKLKSAEGPVKGEITLVVGGALEKTGDVLSKERLVDIIRSDNRPVREIVADLSNVTSLNRSELYRLVLDVRDEE